MESLILRSRLLSVLGLAVIGERGISSPKSSKPCPMAISSTKSTGCKMSNLHLGIASLISFESREINRPPIRLIDLVNSCSFSSLPSKPSSIVVGSTCSTELPLGNCLVTPSQSVIVTVSMVPPSSCSCKATNIRDASQERKSQPVTSMKKSLVEDVTVV